MIKKAQYEDVKSINKIGLEFVNNFDKVYDIKSYLENEKYIILVNEDNFFINAFLIVFQNIDYYELEMIVVTKDYRNKGISKSLLNYFFNNYLKKGDKVLLEVAINNKYALKLYNNFGFYNINIRKKYYNGTDAYVMEKVI